MCYDMTSLLKMAAVNVCDRTGVGKSGRFRIAGIKVDEPVTNLLVEIASKIETNKDDIEIIYCGQRLADPTKPLSSFGVKSGSTLYVLQKTIKHQQTESIADGPSRSEILAAIKSDLLNPAYRSIVEKMLTDPDTIENIISATPGLDKDPVAISMLQDPELLSILSQPQNINNLLDKHPAFGPAAIAIAAAASVEGAKDTPRTAPVTYSLDQMSDEEDESGAQGGQPITASQLAAALSMAQGSPGQASTSGGGSSQGEGGGPPIISSDFFQQAMMQAQSATNEGQLQQLRDMGITDDNMARRALQATGGDIQAALELIFGDGI